MSIDGYVSSLLVFYWNSIENENKQDVSFFAQGDLTTSTWQLTVNEMKTENQEKLSRREKSRAKSNNDRMHAHSTANIKCIFAEISFWCSHRCRRCCCFPHFEIDTTYLILEIWAQTLHIFTSKIYGFVGEWHCICACSSTINAKKNARNEILGARAEKKRKTSVHESVKSMT